MTTSETLTIMQEAVKGILPSGFLDYRVFFDSLYLAVKQKIGSYTYKRFSFDFGFGETTMMHQVVRGYRPLTLKSAKRIFQVLPLEKSEKDYLKVLIEYQNAKSVAKKEGFFNQLMAIKSQVLPSVLDRDLLEYFSEWYHPVIRELVGLPGFKNDVAWIAKQIRPGIKPEQAQKSLDLLERLSLIEYQAEKNSFIATSKRVSSGPRVSGIGLVSYHQKTMELARRSLSEDKGEVRDISSMTLSLTEDQISQLKSRIHSFQLEVLDKHDSQSQGEVVYQMNIQLFPVTNSTNPE